MVGWVGGLWSELNPICSKWTLLQSWFLVIGFGYLSLPDRIGDDWSTFGTVGKEMDCYISAYGKEPLSHLKNVVPSSCICFFFSWSFTDCTMGKSRLKKETTIHPKNPDPSRSSRIDCRKIPSPGHRIVDIFHFFGYTCFVVFFQAPQCLQVLVPWRKSTLKGPFKIPFRGKWIYIPQNN